MGMDGIHRRALRELAEELVKPLPIIYQQSWLTGEVADDWRFAKVMPIYKKVSLTSVPGKITAQFILSALTRHVKDNQGIRPSQHGFMKGRSMWAEDVSSSLLPASLCLTESSSAQSSSKTSPKSRYLIPLCARTICHTNQIDLQFVRPLAITMLQENSVCLFIIIPL